MNATAEEIYVGTDDYLSNRDVIDRWLIDHNLVGKVIPLPSVIRIKDGKVTVDEYVNDTFGKRMLDVNGNAIKKDRTVPLVRDWPLP